MVRAVGRPVTIVIRRADLAEILPLRRAVLRPGYPDAASNYREDDHAVHIGAWDDSALVGCATVFADPWPGPPSEPAAWRLRGMAVEPSYQGSGVGARVLAEAVEAARAAGAPLMWANGRSTAIGFYERYGWRVAGEEFNASDTGLPHFPIVLELSGA
jgi:GNAT superfamily N-acetyltransferase